MISRRIVAAFAILCAFASHAGAQSTKALINTQINTNFPDNTVGAITPQGLRAVTSNIVNSIMPTAPVVSGNIPAFDGTTGLLKDSGVQAQAASWILPMQAPYNAKCDGVTDDATALQAALNAAAGKVLYVPAGYTCATSAVLTIGADNTSIIGGGRDNSGFKSLISNRGAIFYMANRQGITISDLACIGTRTIASWTLPSFGCIDVEQDINAGSAKSGFTFRNLKLSGFNSTYWIQISLGNSTFDMNNVILDNIQFDTVSADIPSDPTPSNNQNYAIAIYGGSSGPKVAKTNIRNLLINGDALCYGVGLYNTNSGFSILNNKILNVGSLNTVAHCTNGIGFTNSYGIFVYDIAGAGFPSYDGLIQGNYILNPYSAGIYTVGEANATLPYNDFNTLISNNEIVGQSETDLPIRGAIILNNYTNSAVIGNKLYNNWAGVVVSGQYLGQIDVKGNECVTNVSGGSCVAIAGAAGTTGNVPEHNIQNNTLVTTGTSSQTVKLTNDNTHYLGTINFTDNKVSGDVQGVAFNALFTNGRVVFRSNTFAGIASTSMLDISGLVGGPAVLQSNVFDLSNSTAGVGLKTTSSLVYNSGSLFMSRNLGTATAFSGVGTTGTLAGMAFSNIATANQVVASSIGLAQPNWSAAAQDFVQNLNISTGALQTVGWINPTNGNNWIVSQSLSGALPISSGGLGCSTYSTFSNANYTVQSTDCQAAQTGSLSAVRTITLPAASTFVAYRRLVIVDTSGTATSTNNISLAPNGTDQINGSNTTQVAINAGYGFVEIESDGVSKWTVMRVSLGSPLTVAGVTAVTNGGTGLSSGTSGGIPYFNSSTSMASTGALTNNGVMIGAGAGNAPTAIAACSTTTVVHGQGAGSAPTCAQVAFGSDVSGLGSGVATAASNALSAASGLTSTIASGTAALGTSAIASAACATVVTVTATNVATTDVVAASFNSDPTGVTGYVPSTNGMLTIFAYPTSGNVNFKVCNNTSGSVTPGAITLNWRVTR